MDGNYNIETIYFDNDLTITANIGVQEIDVTGSKTLETTGKNLRQVLDMLFAARKLPDKVEPAVSVTSNESKSYEVGTIVTPSFNATLSSGSYSYGPDTAIIAKSWKAEFNGETINSSMGTFKDIEIKDTTNTRIKVTATYGDGAIPKDNLGNLINDATELN
jgi:hypothetical protein